MILVTILFGLALSVFPALLWLDGSRELEREARALFGLIWLTALGAVLILIWQQYT